MKCLFLLLNLGFSCSLLKNPILREKCGVKLKTVLLRKSAVLGRQRTNVPKNQLLLDDQRQEFLNGNFRSAQVEVLSGLTKCGPLEKGIANHFSIIALRTP